MKLFSAGPSPFGRKVKVALHVLSLMSNVEVVATDTSQPDTENRKQNPLGKIPTLLADGKAIYDSRVILEYLDSKAGGGKLFPSHGPERIDLLVQAALADGIMDAGILIIYENRMRPEGMQVASIMDYQRGKIERSLQALEAQSLVYENGPMPNAAEIGLACAIDYLDLRAIVDWRAHSPSMRGFMTAFAASVPGYHDTLPEGIPDAPWR
ncbi:MAG: glutathione S-transferase family protein [Candidatus Puniceispirillaceae bacterium]